LGIYDGVAGLITQPIIGAKESGALGMAKGFGKGIGGVVFKPGAAISGAFAYPFKGVHREIQRLGRRADDKHIRRSNMMAGEAGVEGLAMDAREEVVRLWKELEADKKGKKKGKKRGS
jgi:hypothetical protein